MALRRLRFEFLGKMTVSGSCSLTRRSQEHSSFSSINEKKAAFGFAGGYRKSYGSQFIGYGFFGKAKLPVRTDLLFPITFFPRMNDIEDPYVILIIFEEAGEDPALFRSNGYESFVFFKLMRQVAERKNQNSTRL